MPVLLFLLLISALGCQMQTSYTTGGGYISPITPADISYAELAKRYNETIEPFDTFWARTDIVLQWQEVAEDGQATNRREKGEGKFIRRAPGDTALLVEKLGKTYLWAGSNRERYWLFDMVDGDNKRAYIGAFAKLDEPGRRAFPMPVRPDVVPVLLGLVPLPPIDGAQFEPEVEMVQGQYLVEWREARLRMLIDPETFRPTRVDLLDDSGFSLITAKLEGTFPVSVPGVRKSRWPSVCEQAEVYVSGYQSRMTVAMDDATNDPRRARDQMFSFETLSKALKPHAVVSLDSLLPIEEGE